MSLLLDDQAVKHGKANLWKISLKDISS